MRELKREALEHETHRRKLCAVCHYNNLTKLLSDH
jgi:hypothetical protein